MAALLVRVGYLPTQQMHDEQLNRGGSVTTKKEDALGCELGKFAGKFPEACGGVEPCWRCSRGVKDVSRNRKPPQQPTYHSLDGFTDSPSSSDITCFVRAQSRQSFSYWFS
jgi:hypothetical protein